MSTHGMNWADQTCQITLGENNTTRIDWVRDNGDAGTVWVPTDWLRTVMQLEVPPRTFEIWAEGYRATGDSCPARYIGLVQGATLQEACRRHFKGHPNYDKERNTLWGCRLFDNETDARRSFG